MLTHCIRFTQDLGTAAPSTTQADKSTAVLRPARSCHIHKGCWVFSTPGKSHEDSSHFFSHSGNIWCRIVEEECVPKYISSNPAAALGCFKPFESRHDKNPMKLNNTPSHTDQKCPTSAFSAQITCVSVAGVAVT